ncbi:uncharacterized protein LOC129000880 [Macrosteles quadrilineatus]|uniref:uncharacterized protein LOC129000880 n=1 Tax=Macrosteles quadrilineatus TaxID=74068 RepID=UPI0023E335F2|nr:uncharacterized protein LOC129000880 [Macrosteles quadrilineatus]
MEVDNVLALYDFLNNTLNQDRNLFVIKSNLMHKCLLKAEEENSTLDIRSICCRWCLNPLSTQTCNVALQPQKQPKKRLRSLMKKDAHSLNNFQAKLIEKIKSRPATNTMVFKCKFCSKTTPIQLRKPIVESTNEDDDVVVAEDLGKKKKKKKIAKYAGLNIAAVESVKSTSVSINKTQHAINKGKDQKYFKKISVKEQQRMQKALQLTPMPKKKTSLLDAFLDSM